MVPTSTPSDPPRAGTRTRRAHATILPYVLAFLAVNVLVHLVIVLSGNRITGLSIALLAVAAGGYAIYLATVGRTLGRVRYGRLVAHALSYAIVNVGFLLHAYVLIAIGAPAIQGDGSLAIEAWWLGATLGMASFWGLCLIVHGLGALLDHGFEAKRA